MASIDLSLLSVGFGFLDVNAIGEGCTGPIRSFSGMKKNGIVGEKKRKENDFFFFVLVLVPTKKRKEKKRKKKKKIIIISFVCLCSCPDCNYSCWREKEGTCTRFSLCFNSLCN